MKTKHLMFTHNIYYAIMERIKDCGGLGMGSHNSSSYD